MGGQKSDTLFGDTLPALNKAEVARAKWTTEQVRNMKPGRTKFSIEVTEADIATATQNSSSHCVVAEAVHRCIPGASRIDVDMKSIRFTVHGKRWLYLAPEAVSAYVIQFDAGERVGPFAFQIRKPMALRSYANTAKGKALVAARARVARAEKAAGAGGHVASSRQATKKPQPLAVARAELASVEAMPGNISETLSHGRKEPPRTFKEGRVFGMKKLRINNQARHIADLNERLAAQGLELVDRTAEELRER